MGKIQKIKAERKRAEVEGQLKKMLRWRKIVRGGFFGILLIGLFFGTYFGYKALITKYPHLTLKFGKQKTASEEIKRNYDKEPNMQIDIKKKYTANVETSKGTFEIQLNASDTPKTVNNFVFLAKNEFYDGLIFHRIVKDFMIQTGDPNGNGSGGPGYKFDDEKFSGDYAPGTVAMANSGKNTNGSQFFIMTGDYSGGKLPKNYTIFGKVISGMDVVKKIAETPTSDNGQGEKSKPTEEIKIIKISISEI